jgi:hypothetical protein
MMSREGHPMDMGHHPLSSTMCHQPLETMLPDDSFLL